MEVNRADIEALGVELVSRPLADLSAGLVRHSGDLAAAAVMELYRQRGNTKIF